MDVRVTPVDRLLTIHKGTVMSIFLHFVTEDAEQRGPGIENGSEWSNGTVHFDRTGPKDTWIQRKQHQIWKFDLKASEPC